VPHYRLARVYDRLGNANEAAAERRMHQQLTATQKKTGTGMDIPTTVIK
jgi:hypothetical protein